MLIDFMRHFITCLTIGGNFSEQKNYNGSFCRLFNFVNFVFGVYNGFSFKIEAFKVVEEKMIFEVISQEDAREKFKKSENKIEAIRIIADLTVSKKEDVAKFLGVKLTKKYPYVLE